jgi:hypothetical protein
MACTSKRAAIGYDIYHPSPLSGLYITAEQLILSL